MQSVSAAFLAAVSGTYQPIIVIDAWYDGQLVRGNMPVVAGEVDVDITRAIVTSGSGTFASPDGSLTPTAYNAALAPFGSELNIRAGVQYPDGSVELVSVGWFHIDESHPGEMWQQYTQAGTTSWVPTGAQVQVTGSDRMWYVDKAQFLGSPQQPAQLTSAQTEIKRLLQDLAPIDDFSNFTDVAIPKSIVYQTSRVDAIQSLALLMGATVRMSPNGTAALYAIDPGSSVWTVTVGAQLASFQKDLASDGLYNCVITTGQAADGTSLVGVATETTGPLRFGGPFGQVPYQHNNPLVSTQAAADADAGTTLTRLIAQRVVPVTVTCPANYALEGGDVVTIVLPDRTLSGQVTQIKWVMPGQNMQMTVNVPRSQVWT